MPPLGLVYVYDICILTDALVVVQFYRNLYEEHKKKHVAELLGKGKPSSRKSSSKRTSALPKADASALAAIDKKKPLPGISKVRVVLEKFLFLSWFD